MMSQKQQSYDYNRMTYEFAERGNISIEGMDGIDVFYHELVGEYTTTINIKTQKKKHIIKNLNYKKIKEELKKHGEPYKSPFWKTMLQKKRWVSVRKKFIPKLNKENVVIIDNDWLR